MELQFLVGLKILSQYGVTVFGWTKDLVSVWSYSFWLDKRSCLNMELQFLGELKISPQIDRQISVGLKISSQID